MYVYPFPVSYNFLETMIARLIIIKQTVTIKTVGTPSKVSVNANKANTVRAGIRSAINMTGCCFNIHNATL
jgi:hypothetical protein